MCLVKDQTKRPTAEKLLKHSFFKNAKPPELSVKKLFADLPPLWKRVKDLQVVLLLAGFSGYLLFIFVWCSCEINAAQRCCTTCSGKNAFSRTRSYITGFLKHLQSYFMIYFNWGLLSLISASLFGFSLWVIISQSETSDSSSGHQTTP